MVRVCHVAVQRDYLDDIMKEDAFKWVQRSLEKELRGRLVIGAVDRLHPLSGIGPKLEAY